MLARNDNPRSNYSTLSDDDWLNLLSNPEKSKYPIPILPSQETQLRFTGASGITTMQQAFSFYRVIKKFCADLSKPLSSMQAILDFGCGWGRITRCFLRDIEPGVMNGCDCIPEMVRTLWRNQSMG